MCVEKKKGETYYCFVVEVAGKPEEAQVGRAEFRVAFDTFDADRSGTIETHELLKVRKVGGECWGGLYSVYSVYVGVYVGVYIGVYSVCVVKCVPYI